MPNALLESLTLIGVSGWIIIAAIVILLAAGIAVTLGLRARYFALERDLQRHLNARPAFKSKLLDHITRAALEARARGSHEINTQAIIEHGFQTDLRWSLIGERFVKASTGLMIILGLVGTFYGLTMSIGKLVKLIGGNASSATELTVSLTRGLTDALAGMSVAFSTSLVGIMAAIVMTLLGVFASVSDRRTALMIQIEAFVDNVLLGSPRAAGGDAIALDAPLGAGGPSAESVARFGESVAQLSAVVDRFETALSGFAATTRDFREFNLHLKDNVQRMSLSFGDLSDTLKEQVGALKSQGGSRVLPR